MGSVNHITCHIVVTGGGTSDKFLCLDRIAQCESVLVGRELSERLGYAAQAEPAHPGVQLPMKSSRNAPVSLRRGRTPARAARRTPRSGRRLAVVAAPTAAAPPSSGEPELAHQPAHHLLGDAVAAAARLRVHGAVAATPTGLERPRDERSQRRGPIFLRPRAVVLSRPRSCAPTSRAPTP